MKKGKNSKKGLLLTLAIVIVIIVVVFNHKSIQTIKVISNKYEKKVYFKGFYFVDETVVSVNSINKKELLHKEDELVPKGEKITNTILAPVAGILYTKIDGYEGKYNLENITSINLKMINAMISDKTQKAGIKIVNNSEWHVCCEVDKDDFKNFKKGMARDIYISGNYYKGEVMKTFSSTKENYIVFKIKDDINISRMKRGFEGFIVQARYNGFVIPQKAIIEYNGDKGIFIAINGYARFRKITVLTTDGDKVIIAPAERGIKVKDYDEVICNPKGIVDGSRVK